MTAVSEDDMAVAGDLAAPSDMSDPISAVDLTVTASDLASSFLCTWQFTSPVDKSDSDHTPGVSLCNRGYFMLDDGVVEIRASPTAGVSSKLCSSMAIDSQTVNSDSWGLTVSGCGVHGSIGVISR
jgi:hypothetical protein